MAVLANITAQFQYGNTENPIFLWIGTKKLLHFYVAFMVSVMLGATIGVIAGPTAGVLGGLAGSVVIGARSRITNRFADTQWFTKNSDMFASAFMSVFAGLSGGVSFERNYKIVFYWVAVALIISIISLGVAKFVKLYNEKLKRSA